ncbi:MAG: L-threonylcarbamoyladenylate synthase [Bacteroidota bacterium]
MTQEEDIKKAVEVLQAGGIIIYPADTIWSLGCDATNSKAVEKIYKIKFRSRKNNLILLVSDENMIRNYVKFIPDIAAELMISFQGPLTIVYDNAMNLPKNVLGEKGTISMRIPKSEFCLKLLKSFGKPITSTSANLSGEINPVTYHKINPKILDASDYICQSDRDFVNSPKPSTIIKVDKNGVMQVIRG